MGRDWAISGFPHWNIRGRCSIRQQLAAPCVSEHIPDTDSITVLKFCVKDKRQQCQLDVRAGERSGANSKLRTQIGHVVQVVYLTLRDTALEEQVLGPTTELL
jgi:hypothetical protein